MDGSRQDLNAVQTCADGIDLLTKSRVLHPICADNASKLYRLLEIPENARLFAQV